jgi:3',5'-cyclic AMP phosphodiesterase CpdA
MDRERRMIRILLLLSTLWLSGCGDLWVGKATTSDAAAPSVARVEARDLKGVATGTLALPNEERSIKFAVIGDSGRGDVPQHEIAAQMVAFRQRFDYRFVLMAGDNIYQGPATTEDYRLKFEEPYNALLDAGVKFYAALGNHDDPLEVNYKPFNMDGHRYYTFTPPVDLITRLDTRVRFFALDSTYIDSEQLRWLNQALDQSDAEWKIALLHHPLYTSGRYGLAARGIRFGLESALLSGGVDVVFSGHEHLYERSELQNGILYFISGGAGSLRAGDAKRSPQIAKSFDTDYHFMLIEVTGQGLFFQAIDRKGNTVDAGALHQAGPSTRATTAGTAPRR